MKEIFLELLGLKTLRIQNIWSTKDTLVLEIYNLLHKKLYLIADYSLRSPTFHVQKDKPKGAKISTKLSLLLRKYIMGKIFKFEATSDPQIIRANFIEAFKNIALLFDFTGRPQIVLFLDDKPLAQAHHETKPKLLEGIIYNNYSDKLDFNLKKAESYQAQINILYDIEVQKNLSQELKKLKKLKVNLETDLLNFQTLLATEKTAELIRANIHKIKKHETEVIVTDYFSDPVRETTIHMNPGQSAQQLLENMFKKIKKARRGISYIKERLHLITKRITELEHNNLSALTESQNRPQQKKKTAQKRLPYKEFISSDKILLWVGKSARDNDELVLHHARKKEWWFHVRDSTGSHVIVKSSEDALKPDTMIEAAMLAAYFSSYRHENRTEIMYARVKNLRKPKGFAAGKLLVENEKSFVVRLERERLLKILEAQ